MDWGIKNKMTNWILRENFYEEKVKQYIEENSSTEVSTEITTKYNLSPSEEVYVTHFPNRKEVGVICNKEGKISKDISKLIGREF